MRPVVGLAFLPIYISLAVVLVGLAERVRGRGSPNG